MTLSSPSTRVDRHTIQQKRATRISLVTMPEHNIEMSSILLTSGADSWRQYVPLVVSVGVIIDILLGSPLANLVLGPMKRASEKGSGEGSRGNDGGGKSLFSAFGQNESASGANKSKERVDSEAIAQAAIDKARNTLELRKFLEENKTNEQRYDEVRRQIDKQLDELDGK